MKLAIAMLLAGCIVATAQNTNTDMQGYVTNASLMMPLTLTNSTGEIVTNAFLYKLTVNKFIYRTTDGGMGTRSLAILPQKILDQIGYDPVVAAKADQAEIGQQILLRQKQIAQEQAASRAALWEAARDKALSKRAVFYGDVIQKIDAGLLVRTPGSYGYDVGADQSTILLKDYSGYDSVAADDQVHVEAIPLGVYSYTTVNKSENSVHVWTCDLNSATEYYLQH
jgi:hypothetical protein